MSEDFANGSASAAYWMSFITKKEAQDVFDEYAQVLIGIKQEQVKHEFMLALLLEHAGVSPADLQGFIDLKMAEHASKQSKVQ